MAPASAARSRPGMSRTTPPGTGELHQALENARDSKILHAFCQEHGCAVVDVSSDGVRVDMLRVLDLMRRRGYTVAEPTRPQSQQRKGHTTWLVAIALPNGPHCALGFCTPNTS